MQQQQQVTSVRNICLGEIKSAVAKTSATSDTIYEVIYIDVIDPANSTVANKTTAASFKTSNKEKITVDSIHSRLMMLLDLDQVTIN